MWPVVVYRGGEEAVSDSVFKVGDIIDFDDFSNIKVMAVVDNYLMVRRPRCVPFVLHKSAVHGQLLNRCIHNKKASLRAAIDRGITIRQLYFESKGYLSGHKAGRKEVLESHAIDQALAALRFRVYAYEGLPPGSMSKGEYLTIKGVVEEIEKLKAEADKNDE